MSSNILVVISGPSGSGKSTLVARLLEDSDDFTYSVSATTRSPRPGEVDGRDYFFVSREKFKEMIQNGDLLEWAEVYGRAFYGTPKEFILTTLKSSNIVLDADVQGGLQIMETYPDALFIFIEAESVEILEERIRSRGSMSPEDLEARLATARNELTFRDRYDHVITNIDIDQAFSELKQIIQGRLNSGSEA